MSRAFVKEATEDLASGELPERPLSEHPNYVTPRGMDSLKQHLKKLEQTRDELKVKDEFLGNQKVLEIERDIRYYRAQVERAQVVELSGQPSDVVRFGAAVTLLDEEGREQVFHLVGDDEADVAAGLISWASPLARALIGCKVGDTVKWQKPTGNSEVEIIAIAYDSAQPVASL